ncbi:hypothetical protein D1B31_03100 [Neobacillus notoginsengisoli]|uniref:Uncharacterized protein n=1 Tax=Neobacillus notoginsengisoli TaxID=1578198 RepID=A0A417YXX8_9BACI|nr:hypothetical protein D1B31_03100 [Neobacillus notoginsengisoli]
MEGDYIGKTHALPLLPNRNAARKILFRMNVRERQAEQFEILIPSCCGGILNISQLGKYHSFIHKI